MTLLQSITVNVVTFSVNGAGGITTATAVTPTSCAAVNTATPAVTSQHSGLTAVAAAAAANAAAGGGCPGTQSPTQAAAAAASTAAAAAGHPVAAAAAAAAAATEPLTAAAVFAATGLAPYGRKLKLLRLDKIALYKLALHPKFFKLSSQFTS